MIHRFCPGSTTTSLIVTGDDFGISSRVNESIERDFEAGFLQQASLMVTGKAVEEACRIARRLPGLKVGLHLVLCNGQATGVSPFTDSNRNLVASPFWAGLGYAARSGARTWLKREITAQQAMFRSFGFGPTYWDGHCHMHLHPAAIHAATRVLVDFRFIRLVNELKPETFAGAIFNSLSRAAVPRLREFKISHADQVLGLAHTGRMGTESFLRCMSRVTKGSATEIYYHPGAETKPLNIPAVLSEVHRRNMRLCSAMDLLEP